MSWSASNQKMGFEGLLYIGTAGTTGTTQITNVIELTYTIDMEMGSTTVRGTGSSPPIKTEDVTQINISGIDFTMVNDITDAALQTLLAQAMSGGRIAIRTKDYAAGKGFDGDCNIHVEHGEPLDKEQTYKFTCTPSRGSGRTPQTYI